MDELNRDVLNPRGLQLTQVYDETEYIYSAIDLVKDNIFVGGALTMAVLMLFLHLEVRDAAGDSLDHGHGGAWRRGFRRGTSCSRALLILVSGFWFARGALVVGLVIPVSIIGTFVFLNVMGRSLNVISLAGFAFAVGMFIDNAIVVLENIFRRHSLGESPMTATVRGTQEVWGAVLAATLTNVAVFAPVIFMQEEAGQLFRDIALAVTGALLLSVVVSMTVVPVATARLFKDADPSEYQHEVAAHICRSSTAATATRRTATATSGSARRRRLASRSHRRIASPNGSSRRSICMADWFVASVVAINRWAQPSVFATAGDRVR